ncbi:conserved hypothetical protein [Cupriavidus taiwanensis]|uniref:hypothetical protein n=1 Tax=Cupriavidus taiwanensis TaxID=164546 RepID=UPI000E15E3E4|nr:hypothetical protein [Cupriavidus taiwanensis]SOZ14670.1 conserved hypothetical protein [Cupriavidus taiwanensis]SOZ26380.1 conserved hypothetical protein [Cupriavidus taiwanensis]SOZ45244.1 conserved hypothetical protein [Cupriavidus taiwanensis]
MARLTPPSSQKYLMPLAADAVGPQNEAEHRLYELIVEGLSSGEGTEYNRVDEFAAEFRARLQGRKR